MLKIGSLVLDGPLILAPMAGITDLAFRLVAKRRGASLVTTEMVSALGLCLGQKKTMGLLRSCPEERPLSVQIFGSNPDDLSRAAELACAAGADAIDINMGCPVKKVVKTGAGGALLRQPCLVEKIVSSVRRMCPVPLTVKTRAGWSPQEDRFLEVLKAIESGGADAVTVHARYVTQGFSGKAQWSKIALAKQTLTIPVIGNGDVTTSGDASAMMRITGCEGVMIGRAAATNPWLFGAWDKYDGGPTPTDRRSVIHEHIGILSQYTDPKRLGYLMRGILIRYTRGLPSSAAFRERISGLSAPTELLDASERFFSNF